MLKGAYSEGDALRIYNKVKVTNDFAGFLHAFMHDDDYQVARNTLWGLTKATDAELAQLQPAMNELIDLAISTDNFRSDGYRSFNFKCSSTFVY